MRRITLLLAISLSIVPLASATWSFRGESEPDSTFDDPAYMWFDPHTSAGHKIYFSGFQKATPEGDFNANVGLVGSRILPPETAATVVLGFWRDCNEDGYIGHVESAMVEYRVELLLDDTVCSPTAPVPGQAIYPYNDGSWVRELIWIGASQLPYGVGGTSANPTNFYDEDTRVWGDYGMPGGVPTTLCPGGNLGFRSVGAILDYADCQSYYRGVRTLNDVEAQTGAPTGGWDMEDIDNSPSPLNIDNPAYYYLYGPEEPEGHPDEGDYRGFSGGIFGRDNAATGEDQERFVTVIDCESRQPDTSPEVNTPDDVTDSSTYPSVYESLNDTYDWASYLNASNAAGFPTGGSCEPTGSGDEGLPYNAFQPDGYSEPTTIGQGRKEVDHAFIFNAGSRNWPTGAFSGSCRPNSYAPGPLGYCPPADLGLSPARHDFAVGGAYRANTITALYPIYVRESMRGENPDFGGWFSTYYAKLGGKTMSLAGYVPLPGQADRTYGVEACGDNSDGVHNFWNCDPEVWRQRCMEGETNVGPCYVVGETYHMRDVDCWDNTLVRGTPTQVGLAITSESGPCVDHGSNGGPLS